jgi:hypothetical protein
LYFVQSGGLFNQVHRLRKLSGVFVRFRAPLHEALCTGRMAERTAS